MIFKRPTLLLLTFCVKFFAQYENEISFKFMAGKTKCHLCKCYPDVLVCNYLYDDHVMEWR